MIIPMFAFAIAASFTPGPNNLISLSTARQKGVRATMPFIWGVGVGCMFWMISSSFLQHLVTDLIPVAGPVMAVLGSLYMLYLAIRMLLSKGSNNEERKAVTFWNGLALQFINPKVILYGLTAASSFIVPLSDTSMQTVLYALLFTAVGISANMTWALGGTWFNRFLEVHDRSFRWGMALVLVYCGISMW